MSAPLLPEASRALRARPFALVLPACLVLLAGSGCGSSETGGGGEGGAAGAVACDVDDFYARAHSSRSAVCEKVTSCYGPAEDDSVDCYVPLPEQNGGLAIVVTPATPTDELRTEGECLCREDADAMVGQTRCGEQADAALVECLEDCPEDPEPCVAEYVITCGAFRSRIEALMQREGACFRGTEEGAPMD